MFSVVIVLLNCSPSKLDKMENKEKSNFSCAVETGICSPTELINKALPTETISDNEQKIRLTYYYDALCGWCYGFSPVMSKLKEKYGDQLEVEVISGGLFLGNRSGYINDVAPHIKAGAYKTVEDRTGVKFGAPFLEGLFGEGKTTLNSLPPSIALCIVKEHLPEKELVFAEMLLHAVYFEGFDPVDIQGYGKYAEKIGFDKDEFNSKMQNSKYESLALKEFEKFQASEFRGMPALVLQTAGKPVLLSNGYTSFEKLDSQLKPFQL